MWVLVVIAISTSGVDMHTEQYFNESSCRTVAETFENPGTRRVTVTAKCVQINEADE